MLEGPCGVCRTSVLVAVEGDGALLFMDRDFTKDGLFVLKAQDGPWRAFRDVPLTLAPRYRVHACPGSEKR